MVELTYMTNSTCSSYGCRCIHYVQCTRDHKLKHCLFRFHVNPSKVRTGADGQNITDHEDALINGEMTFFVNANTCTF